MEGDKVQIGVIQEQGDLGLGFSPITENVNIKSSSDNNEEDKTKRKE